MPSPSDSIHANRPGTFAFSQSSIELIFKRVPLHKISP